MINIVLTCPSSITSPITSGTQPLVYLFIASLPVLIAIFYANLYANHLIPSLHFWARLYFGGLIFFSFFFMSTFKVIL